MRAAALLALAGALLVGCQQQQASLGATVAACHARGGRYLLHPENEPDLEQIGYPHCVSPRPVPAKTPS